MSGAAKMLPTGFVGAAIPPTLAILSVGWPVPGRTGCGNALVARRWVMIFVKGREGGGGRLQADPAGSPICPESRAPSRADATPGIE